MLSRFHRSRTPPFVYIIAILHTKRSFSNRVTREYPQLHYRNIYVSPVNCHRKKQKLAKRFSGIRTLPKRARERLWHNVGGSPVAPVYELSAFVRQLRQRFFVIFPHLTGFRAWELMKQVRFAFFFAFRYVGEGNGTWDREILGLFVAVGRASGREGLPAEWTKLLLRSALAPRPKSSLHGLISSFHF